MSRGRTPPLSSLLLPTLLLTTMGRKTGQPRTIPLVYVRRGDDYLVANARPRGERLNPWVLNLEASGTARVRVDGRSRQMAARRLSDREAEEAWPAFVRVWPAFGEHFAATGERTVFVLEDTNSLPEESGTSPAETRMTGGILLLIKGTHTGIWVIVEGAMVYLLAAGLAGRSDRRAAIAGLVVAAESAVFLANGARCPLSDMAERIGAERGSVTDIFLPDWLARNLPLIHVPLIGAAVFLHGRNLKRRRFR